MGTTVGVATKGGIVDALLELLELLPPELVELLELALLTALELELFDAALEAELLELPDLLELLELLGRGVGVPQSWSRSGQGSVLLDLWPQSRSPSLHELLLELDRRAGAGFGLAQVGKCAGFAPCPLQQLAASIGVTFG